MLAALIGSTALIVAVSILVGTCALALGGTQRWSWGSGAIGFALLMVILGVAGLPGRMIPGLVLIALLAIGGLVRMVRRPELRPPLLLGLLTLAPTAVLVAFPFIAAGRIGILGVAFDNDTAAHLLLIDAMFDGAVDAVTPLLDRYPLGPHGIAAGLATLGVDSESALLAVLLAVPVLTAFAALAVLGRPRIWVVVPAAVLAAFPYLSASYFAEGSFKETILALLLIGVAGVITEAQGREDEEHRYLPFAALLAGCVAVYGHLGVVWPLAGVALLAVPWAVTRLRVGGLPAIGDGVRTMLYPVTVAGLATVFLIAPQLSRVQAFYEYNAIYSVDSLGNLAGPVSPREMLGVWFTGDFRFASPHGGLVDLGGVLVGLLILASFVWLLRRGQGVLPAFGLAALIVAAASEETQGPYTAAKAFAIASPFVWLLVGRALNEAVDESPGAVRLGAVGATTVAAGLGLWSTGLVLRSAAVGDTTHRKELRALQPLIGNRPTLFLGNDDFVNWELAGTPVTPPFLGIQQLPLRTEKDWKPGQSFDIDSIAPTSPVTKDAPPTPTLDRFQFVVAPHVATDSAMPENFRLVATRGAYDLYRRTAPTTPRSVLPGEGQEAAARLDCSTPAGRSIVAAGGVAGIRAALVKVPLQRIAPRQHQAFDVTLPAGTWDLALRYESNRALRFTGPGLDVHLPAALERTGSVWPAGALTVTRRQTLRLDLVPEYRSFSVDASVSIAPTELLAQRRAAERTVPIRQACGQLVDWYRSASAAQSPQGAR